MPAAQSAQEAAPAAEYFPTGHCVQAVALAAVMEFAGAYLAGGEVSDTIAHGIIDSRHFAAAPQLLIVVMLASLLAAGSWLLLASARAWPVAATHALVGALCGAAIAAFGADAINGLTIVEIGFAWLLAPLGGGLIVDFSERMERSILSSIHENDRPPF